MGKNEIQKNEWKCGYPVKKAILVFIWLFLVFVIVAGIKYCICIEANAKSVWTLILVSILMLVTFKPIWKYVRTPYHSMPYFNKIFTKEELEELLENETFSDIEYLKENGMSEIDVAESEHWLRLNRRYLSKEMMVLCRTIPPPVPDHRTPTPVWAMYITGDTVEIKLERELASKEKTKFAEYMWFILDVLPETVVGKREEEVRAIFGEIYRNYVKDQTGVTEKEVIKSLIQNAVVPRSVCVYKMPGYLQRTMKDYSNGCNVYYKRFD